MTARRDVLVIGAGIIGSAIAAELSRRGAAVTVLDDRPRGMGATQASAGMLAPYSEAHDEGPLLTLASLALDAFDPCVARLLHDEPALVYQRTGSLDIACGPDRHRQLRALADALQQRGVAHDWLSHDDLRTHDPVVTADAEAALYIRPHGFVDAWGMTQALGREADRHGAVRIAARATGVSVSSRGPVVDTAVGPFRADDIVVATGAWSASVPVDDAAPLPVAPVKGQLLHLSWPGATPRHVLWSDDCYLVPWPNRTVLVGATVEHVGFDEESTQSAATMLRAAAERIVPGAARASLMSARAGLRPATPDHLPIIGRSTVHPRVVYATGHYRNGVLMAPLTARVVSDLVLDGIEHPALASTRPSRFGAV